MNKSSNRNDSNDYNENIIINKNNNNGINDDNINNNKHNDIDDDGYVKFATCLYYSGHACSFWCFYVSTLRPCSIAESLTMMTSTSISCASYKANDDDWRRTPRNIEHVHSRNRRYFIVYIILFFFVDFAYCILYIWGKAMYIY